MTVQRYFIATVMLCLLPWSMVSGKGGEPRAERVLEGTPLAGAFYENRGQVIDATGRARPELLYYAFQQGACVYFTATGWHTVYQVKESEGVSEATGAHPIHAAIREQEHLTGMRQYRMDVTLQGCNRDVKIEALDPLPRQLHHYLAHCPEGITASAHGMLRYRNVYNNIDLLLYAAREGLKYEFVVRPGGRVEDIRLLYDGIDGVVAQPDGSLKVLWPRGYSREDRPYSYLDGSGCAQEVASSYTTDGNEVRFSVDRYDESRTLIIDPWSTYFGGSNTEKLAAITCDGTGAVLCAGITYSRDFPIHAGWQSAFPNASYTAMAMKFHAAGALSWAALIGGSNSQYANGIAVDASNSVIIGGSTQSVDFPVFNGYQMVIADSTSNSSAYLIKLDSSGQRIWSTYFGGSGGGGGFHGVGVDSAGNVYAAGATSSPNFPTLRAHQSQYAGGIQDLTVTKLTSDGKLLFSSYWGGSGTESGSWLAVDARGNVAICGRTTDSTVPLLNAYQTSKRGPSHLYDMILAMYDSSGGQMWSTYLGGEGNDFPDGKLTFDRNGNVLIGGSTVGLSYPVHNAVPAVLPDRITHACVSRFNPQGQLLWSTYFGGSSTDKITAMVCDSSGNLYLAGITGSSDFPVVSPAYPSRPDPLMTIQTGDSFVLMQDSANTVQWSTCFGGADYDECMALAFDQRGTLYLAGHTQSDDFPVYNAVQGARAGKTDVFIHRFHANGSIPVALSRISAHRLNDVVILDWRSEIEVNAHGYVIERRYEHREGETGSEWSDIGFVPSVSQGTEGRDYQHVDTDAGTRDRRVFYRLRMVDLDGSFAYSRMVEVAPASDAAVAGFETAYPSPARDWLTLRFTLPVESRITVSVHDICGREMLGARHEHIASAGTHTIAFPVHDWYSGLYLCTMTTSSGCTFTRHVMVMR